MSPNSLLMAHLEPKKELRISVRPSPEIKQRLADVFRDYGVSETELVLDAVEAALDYIDVNHGYRRPILVTFDREKHELMKALAAEEGDKKKKKP